jgi:hypothetical protein
MPDATGLPIERVREIAEYRGDLASEEESATLARQVLALTEEVEALRREKAEAIDIANRAIRHANTPYEMTPTPGHKLSPKCLTCRWLRARLAALEGGEGW